MIVLNTVVSPGSFDGAEEFKDPASHHPRIRTVESSLHRGYHKQALIGQLMRRFPP